MHMQKSSEGRLLKGGRGAGGLHAAMPVKGEFQYLFLFGPTLVSSTFEELRKAI